VSWQQLVGHFELSVDEGLRDIGRKRHYEADGRAWARPLLPRTGLQREAEWGFIAKRIPRSVVVSSLNAKSPLVAAWTSSSSVVWEDVDSAPRALPTGREWGDLGLQAMLWPSWIPDTRGGTSRLPGSDASVPLALFSASADSYTYRFDEPLRLLREWAAIIDGEVAMSCYLAVLHAA